MSISILNTDAELEATTLLNAESAQTVSGLKTFSRSTNPPFAVNAGAAAVTNLDADKLDGQEGTYYLDPDNHTWDTQTANTVFAGPSSGSAAAPAFRALVAADLPTSAVRVLDRDVSLQSVSNTTTETTVYSVTVPANLLSTNRALRISFLGTLVNTVGSAQTANLEVAFGGTDLATNSISYNNNTTNEVLGEFIISNVNATNAQRGWGTLSIVSTAGGNGWIAASAYGASSTATVDTTSDQTLALKITLGSASASLAFHMRIVQVEVL